MVKNLRIHPPLSIISWILITLAFHFAWEFFQLPFYTLWENGNYQSITAVILHCTLGDGLISMAVWFVVGALLRNWGWLLADIGRGGIIAWLLGLAYTSWSEWRNVYLLGSWQYADSMPTIAGVGLLPLMQWALVPPLSWLLYRYLAPYFPAKREEAPKE
ncbi:MAG: hypothetical protein WCD07_07710 [Burkholderiales bacterium]